MPNICKEGRAVEVQQPMHRTHTWGANCDNACNSTAVPCIAGAAGHDDEDMACAEALVEYSSDHEGAAAWQEELKTQLQYLVDVSQELMEVSQREHDVHMSPAESLYDAAADLHEGAAKHCMQNTLQSTWKSLCPP